MGDLVFTELAGDDLVPGVAVETNLDAGRTGPPSLTKDLLLTGYKTSAGSATVGAVDQPTSLADAIALYGIGSHLAVMYEAAVRVSPRIPIYCMPITESSGVAAGGTAGTGDITLATTATAVGTLRVWVANRLFRIGVETGDTPTVVGDKLESAINAHYNLPATATNTAGVVDIDARNKGLGGNSIRIRCDITSGIGMTATASGATLTGGTLEGAPATLLAAIEGRRFHIIACWSADSTTQTKFEDHIDAVSDANVARWGQVVFPSVEDWSTVLASSAAIDNHRCQFVWHYKSDQPEFELAAAHAAIRAREVHRNLTLDNVVVPGITPQYDQTAWPTHADVQLALLGGVCALIPEQDGTTVRISRNVHSRGTDATRTEAPQFRDCEVLEISDYIDQDLIDEAKRRFSRKSLKVSSPAGTPNVITPDRFLIFLHERMRIWDGFLDYTQGAEADIEAGATIAQQNSITPTRMDAGYPFRPVFGCHKIAVRKDFTLPDIF